MALITLTTGYIFPVLRIPHLAKGQKIAQFKKVFLAATSALQPDQQLACLPVYIQRTEKLQKSSSGSEALASETFAFPVEQEEQWALELQKDVNEFRSRLDVPGAAMSYNFDSSIKQEISIKQEFSDNAPCHCMSTPYPDHTLSVSRSPSTAHPSTPYSKPGNCILS